VFPPKKQEGIERRLDWIADGKRLDCGLRDEETGTGPLIISPGRGCEECLRGIVLAFQRPARR
jgi:hypothetical protein